MVGTFERRYVALEFQTAGHPRGREDDARLMINGASAIAVGAGESWVFRFNSRNRIELAAVANSCSGRLTVVKPPAKKLNQLELP